MRPKALIKILRTTFVHFLLEMGQTAIIFCMVLWAMQMANQIRNLLFCNLQLYHAIRRQDLHIWNTKISLLMIYEMNHTWTAEMKWKWRNDRRSECNLCNCVKKPEKNSGLQRGLNPWPRDTGAMLYQLSYEATDVGSRSIVGSYVPVKEMSVLDGYARKTDA